MHAAAQPDARGLQPVRRFDRGFHRGGRGPFAIGAFGPAQVLRFLGGLQREIRVQHEVTETRSGMRLRRLDHDGVLFDARLPGDGGADPVRVFTGDDSEVQDHQADAPPAGLEDDGPGKERIQHGLSRAVVSGAAARQVRPRRRGYVDHRSTGPQLV